MFNALKKMAKDIESEMNKSVGSVAAEDAQSPSGSPPASPRHEPSIPPMAASTPSAGTSGSKVSSSATGTPGRSSTAVGSMSQPELLAHSQKQTMLLKRLKTRCDELSKKNKELGEKNLALKKAQATPEGVGESEAAAEELSSAVKAMEKAEATNKKLMVMAAKLKKDCAALKSDNEMLRAAVAKAESQESPATDEAEALEQLRQEMSELQDRREAELSALKDKHEAELSAATTSLAQAAAAEKEEAVAAARQEVEQQQSAALVAAVEGERTASTAERNKLQDEVESLRAQLTTHAEKLAASEADLDNMRRRGNVSLRDVPSEGADAIEEKVVAGGDEAAALRRELDRVTAELEAAAERASKAEEETSQLQRQLAAAEAAARETDETSSKADGRIADLTDQIKALRDTHAEELRALEQEHDAALASRDQLAAKEAEAHVEAAARLQDALDAAEERANAAKASDESEAEAAADAAEATQALQRELEQAREQLSAIQAEMQTAAGAAAQSQAALEAQLEGSLQQVSDLQADKEAVEASLETSVEKSRSLERRAQQLGLENQRLKLQLDDEVSGHARTKEALQTANTGASQSSMLDLELADYERSVQSLNSQLADAQAELDRQRQNNSELQGRLEDQKAQTARVEAGKAKVTEQSGKLKALLMKTKTELKQRTAEVESFTKGSADLAVQSEERAREVEDLKVNLANVTVALSSAQAEQREIEMAKDLEIRNLRFELETAQREAAQFQADADKTAAEFRSYKVRAHSVLKSDKHKSAAEQSSKQAEELQTELDALKQRHKAAEAELAEATSAVQELEADYDALSGKYESHLASAEAAARDHKERIAQMTSASDAFEQEQMAVITKLRSENSTLALSHKRKMKEAQDDARAKEEAMEASIALLKQQLLDAEQQAEGPAGSDAADPSDAAHGRKASGQPRRQSDSASAVKAPATAEYRRVAPPQQDLASLLADEAGPENELQLLSTEELQGLVVDSKAQLQHMSRLQEDSENQLQRVTEQAMVLKDEIRRLERNSQRESTANLEYLKNVILKFLESEEEKAQLIPVVGMLLHFSPEETERARKAHEKALQGMTPSKQQSWGSYLGQWTP